MPLTTVNLTAAAVVVVVAVAADDEDEDGVQWRRRGGVQWRQQCLTVMAVGATDRQ